MSSSISLSEQATWWTSGLFFQTLLNQARDIAIVGNFSIQAYEKEFGSLLARIIYTVSMDSREGRIEVGPVRNYCGNDLCSAYLKSLDGLIEFFENDGRYNKRLG